jgi:hypothetical protein
MRHVYLRCPSFLASKSRRYIYLRLPFSLGKLELVFKEITRKWGLFRLARFFIGRKEGSR